MKTARLLLGIALLLSVSLGLLALQRGGGSARQQQSYTSEREEPSEFYFSRLRYNSGYASGGQVLTPRGPVSADEYRQTADLPDLS